MNELQWTFQKDMLLNTRCPLVRYPIQTNHSGFEKEQKSIVVNAMCMVVKRTIISRRPTSVNGIATSYTEHPCSNFVAMEIMEFCCLNV